MPVALACFNGVCIISHYLSHPGIPRICIILTILMMTIPLLSKIEIPSMM